VKAHRTDKLSLIFGLIFVALALRWIFGWTFSWRLDVTGAEFGLFVAGGLIVLGVIGLVRSLRSDRRNGPASEPDELP